MPKHAERDTVMANLSVCLSHAGIVLNAHIVKLITLFDRNMTSSLTPTAVTKFQGHFLSGGITYTSGGKIAIFDEIAVNLGNGTR